MIVNRKHGVYKIYELKGVRGLYLLAETGQDDEIDRREKQKEIDWNQFQGLAELFISRSRR